MDPLAPLIDSLHAQGRLRVWSLIITAFGDLVQQRAGEISSIRLGALMGRIGIENGAVRTALSRLSQDGWVVRERVGRGSLYRLSPQGAERFGPATSRIYAPPRLTPVRAWRAEVTLNDSGSPQLQLLPEDAPPNAADCVVQGPITQLSEAFRQSQLSAEHADALTALSADLTALSQLELLELDAAAARMLLIHRWRRIVLRFPELAAELMPAEAALPNPRAAVASAYARLSPEAERWMDVPLNGEKTAHPANPGLAQRFVSAPQS